MKQITFNKICLNCFRFSGIRDYYDLSDTDTEFNFESPKPTHEFLTIQTLQRIYFEKRVVCEFCKNEGAFDFREVEIENQKIYKTPESEFPQFQFIIHKSNTIIKTTLNPIQSGAAIILRTFFHLVLGKLKVIPESLFIKHNEGYADIVVYYDYEYGKCIFNKFFYVGFSKTELSSSILEMQKRFDHFLASNVTLPKRRED